MKHLGLDVDINTWLFTLPFIAHWTSSALLITLPKQEEVAASSSPPTLPTDQSQTSDLPSPITTKSFAVSQDHPSGSLATFDKRSKQSRQPTAPHSSDTTLTGRFLKHQSPPKNVATTHGLVEAAPFALVCVVTTGVQHILPNIMDLVTRHACL